MADPRLEQVKAFRTHKTIYGMALSINKLHQELRGIREVINVFKKTKKKVPTQSVVSRQTEVQKRLFDLFEMAQFLSSWGPGPDIHNLLLVKRIR